MEAAIAAYVQGTLADVPPSVLDDVATEQISLLDVVRLLGPHLTSESDATRTLAVTLLSRIVTHLAEAAPAHPQLTRQVIRTLTAFFSEKLSDATEIASMAAREHNDGHLVPASAPIGAQQKAEQRTLALSQMLVACLEALLALSGAGYDRETPLGRDHFGGQDACVVSRALFGALELRNHPQPLRHTTIRLLDSLVARNRAALLTMRRAADDTDGPEGPPGSGFVTGYAKLVGGEKDPRNLLMLFGIARVLLLEWEMDRVETESFFNILFCYFPITFRPPPDDPYHITPDMLKEALRACISASPAFAPMAMPLLLEKLAASGGTAKVDVLRTLDAALPVYGRAAAEANADALWGHLKLDVLQPTDDESAACAQTLLTTLLRVVYGAKAEAPPGAMDDAPTPGASPALPGIGTTVLDECRLNLGEPGKALAKATLQLVQSLLDATPTTSAVAIHAVLTQLLRHLDEHDEDEAAVLPLLAALLDLVQRLYAEPAADESAAPPARTYDSDGRPLDAFHDALFSALLRGLERRRDVAALHGLVMLTQVPALLRPSEVEYATRAIQAVAVAPDVAHAEALRDAALGGLERIARTHTRAVEAHTLPFLLAQLPYTLPADAELGRIRDALGALARLCVRPELFDALVVRLCALLDTALGEPRADAVRVGYACALLATLQVCLEAKRAARHTDVPKYAVQLPLRLLGLLRTDDALVGADAAVVQQVSEVVTLVVPTLPAERQAALLHDVAKQVPIPAPGAPRVDAERVAVLAAVAVAARREAALPADATAWLRAAWALVVDRAPPPALATQATCFFLCALANKYVAADEARELADALWPDLAAPTRPLAARVAAVHAWVWIARGLLARSDDTGAAMLDRVRTELFPAADIGMQAANALRILARHDALITRANGFQVRMLYKQRLLDRLLPQLVTDYRAHAESPAAMTYLVALATLLPALPDAAVSDRVTELLPLLVHTLGIPDAHARASAARALATALTELPERPVDPPPPTPLEEALQASLATLVPRLLAQVPAGPHTPAPTRTAALQVLGALVPRLAHDALVPYRRDVVHALGTPRQGVDDARRSVRVHAVDCRDAWFRINTLE
ncbi:hypothetical protein MBRA1_003232 [Malassezia brasiliensis]|uniref:MMS19 nucleotide excision repair protein n=1 Tax=Malassezia brasiliensis TaxID=1821822 RepID=A0AAF0IR05_9BASI|nr:hypothetical protein MBRA1_003232 [Malassezia brasiliensis]